MAEVTDVVEKQRKDEKTVDDLHNWVDELNVKLLDAKDSAKNEEKIKMWGDKVSEAKNSVVIRQLELQDNITVKINKGKLKLVGESQKYTALEHIYAIQL